MTTRSQLIIIILAAIIILLGGFFIWYSSTFDNKNSLKIVMDDTIFSEDENITFKIKNNSLGLYCFSQNFSYSSKLDIVWPHYPHSDFGIEKYNGSEWTTVARPSDTSVSGYFIKEFNISYPVMDDQAVQIFNSKIFPFTQKEYEISKTATFSYGKYNYTWELPVGEYRLKIYYGQCQKKSLFGDKTRTEYYNSLKTVYSPTFEIQK